MKKNKREKGSVVLFVTVTCMFILIMLTILVMNLSNTKQSQDKQVKQITEQYQVTNQDMEMEYQKKDIEVEFSTEYGKIEVVWVNKSNEIISEPLAPVLNGMTPVYWDDNGTEHETTAGDSNWYKYVAGNNKEDSKNSHWANAINLTEEGSVKSYFVWIPRYAYRIIYYDKDYKYIAGYYDGDGLRDSKGNELKDKIDITKEGVQITEKYNGYKYIVHPAFETNTENGGWDKELSGIWVGKYEASRSDAQEGATTKTSGTKIKVAPNVKSFTNITIGNVYTYSKAYDEGKESHQMKNSEWGAIAYLTHSQYGRNSNEVSVNQCSSYMTGTGRGTGDSTIYNSQYEWTAITDAQKYNGEIGKDSSSTGNIYGVYDLSGGAWDYVAVFNKDGTSNMDNGSSFTQKDGNTITTSDKWATVYSNNDTGTNKGEKIYEVGKTGDATKEVWISSASAWNSDCSYFVYTTYPFFIRGGWCLENDTSGVFCSFSFTGNSYDSYSFHVVLPGV